MKDDLQCTTAELVYGTTLHLPGDFFISTDNSTDDPTTYITRFKTSMSKLKPPPACQQLHNKSHVSNALSHCTHVFIRHDGVRKPLQPPYDVLKHGDKHFTSQLKDRKDVTSLDHLKPAHNRHSGSI